MLEELIKSKKITFILIFPLLFWTLLIFYKHISLESSIIGYLSIASVLFYTYSNQLIKSPFITNVIFFSLLVSFDFQNFSLYAQISNLILMVVFLLSEYGYATRKRYLFFDVTILIFAAIYIYPPAIFFSLFVFLLLINKSVRKVNVWLIPPFITILTGIGFLGASYLFDFDAINFLYKHIDLLQHKDFNIISKNIFQVGVLGVLTIAALIDHFQSAFKQAIDRKKSYELVIYFLFTALLCFFLTEEALLFTLFPSSILIGKFIYFRNNRFWKYILLFYFPIYAIIHLLSA